VHVTPRPPLQALIRDERGLTLFELLISVSVGLVVLGVVFLVMDVSLSQTTKVNDRVEAVQRGRITMEQITRQLRSQVCPSATGAAVLEGSDNEILLYVDLSGGTATPQQRRITYEPTAKTLTERDYVATGTWPNVTYNTAPQTRELLKDVVPVSGTPIFTYYAFATSGTQTHQRLSTPLLPANLPRVVRIGVSFVAQPSRTHQSPRSTSFQSAVDTRTDDPNNPSESTRCL
jgi:type II secretory pathway component PulJ